MRLEYYIDNSNIKNLKNFILKNNTDLKKAMLEKPKRLKILLEATIVALIVVVVIFLLSLNAFIFPDATGNYFSFFFKNFYYIMSIFLPTFLSFGMVGIIFYYLLFQFTYLIKNKKVVSKFINSKYMGFKGMNKVSIKENEIQIERGFSNLIIESKIMENIIIYENTLYFLDKNNYVLLFIPFEDVNINKNEIISNIEKFLEKKVKEV